jgi:hypothetical protein
LLLTDCPLVQAQRGGCFCNHWNCLHLVALRPHFPCRVYIRQFAADNDVSQHNSNFYRADSLRERGIPSFNCRPRFHRTLSVSHLLGRGAVSFRFRG